MERLLERWWPLTLTLVLTIVFHIFIMPVYSDKILSNLNNILSMTSTLSSVLLSFVGVIIGVVGSLAHSSLLSAIKQAEAYGLLREYIFVSFLGCMLALIYSIILIFVTPDNNTFMYWLYFDVLVCLLTWMITTSARMIMILFELVGLNRPHNKNNLWNEKPYSPDHV